MTEQEKRYEEAQRQWAQYQAGDAFIHCENGRLDPWVEEAIRRDKEKQLQHKFKIACNDAIRVWEALIRARTCLEAEEITGKATRYQVRKKMIEELQRAINIMYDLEKK